MPTAMPLDAKIAIAVGITLLFYAVIRIMIILLWSR